MPASVGHICHDAAHYADSASGELKPKYFLVLAAPERGDIVVRLLTSRYEALRPMDPPCFHGDPYPGFYLGVLGGELGAKSWLDLRPANDLDPWDFERHLNEGRIRQLMPLPRVLLRPALECAARAQDTTRQQERMIRNVIDSL